MIRNTVVITLLFSSLAITASQTQGIDSSLSKACQVEITIACAQADARILKPFLTDHPNLEELTYGDVVKAWKGVSQITYSGVGETCQKELIAKGLIIIGRSAGAKLFAYASGADQKKIEGLDKWQPSQEQINSAWVNVKTGAEKDVQEDVEKALFVPGDFYRPKNGYLFTQCELSGSLPDLIEEMKTVDEPSKQQPVGEAQGGQEGSASR